MLYRLARQSKISCWVSCIVCAGLICLLWPVDARSDFLLTRLSGAQVAFPYLYNNRPRRVRISAYHHPMVMYIKMEDPDLPAFYYDPLIHPIAFYKNEATSLEVLDDEDEEAFELPEGLFNCFPCADCIALLPLWHGRALTIRI